MSVAPTRERIIGTLLPFSTLALADMAGKILSFLTIPMITRRFGDAAFGDLGVATQLMVFAVLLGTAGLDVYSVRTVARAPAQVGRWASTVILVRLLLGAAVYAGLLALALLVPQYRSASLLIAIFGLSLFTRAIYLDWAAQALRQTRVLALAMLGLQAGYFFLILGVVRIGAGAWTVAASQLVAEAVAAAALLWWFHRGVAPLESPLPIREWPSVLRHSMPFAGSQILRGASLGLDLVLLSLFVVPREQIGWFSAALKLFGLCSGVAAVYFLVLLPRLSERAAHSMAAMRAELRHSARLMLPIAAAVALVVGLLARPLLRQVGGSSAFESGATALQVLLAAVVVGLANGHLRNALFAVGRQQADFRNVAMSAVLHLGFKVALIPSFGTVGVALGTLGGETALTALGWHSLRQAQHGTTDTAVHPGSSSPPPSAKADHEHD